MIKGDMRSHRCVWCGGSLINDDGEAKCLACGRPVVVEGSEAICAEEARKEVELDAEVAWDEYLASRRESWRARYGKSSPGDIADYKRRYYLAHREKALADMLLWKRANKARVKEYMRRYKASRRGKVLASLP